jgi:5-methylcytosine-specific restriction endonuclease McrA
MKDELLKSAKSLHESIERVGVATHNAALEASGALVQLRYWLRASRDATEQELDSYLSALEEALEKIEDVISMQVSHAKPASETCLEKLSSVLNLSTAIINQYGEKNLDQINDPTLRAQVWGLTGGKCAYCKIDLAPDGQGNGETHTFCVEHVVPVSYGGPNNIRNYVPSCKSCNNSKGDRHVLTFIQNNLPTRLNHIGISLVANGGEAAE